MTNRSVLAVALLVGALSSAELFAQRGERPAGAKPKVDIVQTVGCAEQRAGSPATWWLTRATAPQVTREGVFNTVQVEEAKKTTTPGSLVFHLVGVPEFVDAAALLKSGDRASFTMPDQVNATGELRPGRTVLVKGLLIESGGESRINLLAVVAVADTCR